MVIEHSPGKWKFTHTCPHGKHSEGPFSSRREAEQALDDHEEKCGS